ncbi:type IV secretion protein IcmC [Candidiatus Paracoxiella cheracis]|uniref:type IV secretion protein IcmC n=1 Tax=Candidiatus Paracoxiella cheracis TaxID=3405120 RepID=UPI003BF537EB
MNPTTLMNSLGTIAGIVQTVSILMGLSLFMSGLFRLKRYGEMRTFMSHQMTLAGPLLTLIGGICLLSLPLVVRTGLLSFWGTSNPLRYSGPQEGFEQLIPPIIMLVRLLGVGSFIRGIILFSRGGREGSPPGTVGKAMIHIFGGLLCIHILGTVDLVKEILGWSVPT